MTTNGTNTAKFSIGEVVKHKFFDFRGVIYDVDFEFNNSEEWYQSIPKDVRPKKNQPFYHLLAENNDITYEAYVSEQNLESDDSDEPIKHPLIKEIFFTIPFMLLYEYLSPGLILFLTIIPVKKLGIKSYAFNNKDINNKTPTTIKMPIST